MRGLVKMKVLVCHTGRHHVMNLFCGVSAATDDAFLAVPFYCSGFFKMVSRLNFEFSLKIRGYSDERIKKNQLLCGQIWSALKCISIICKVPIDKYFDFYVSIMLWANIWRPKTVVVMQNHMPKTISIAKRRGINIWIDVINYSELRANAINRVRNDFGLQNFSVSWWDSFCKIHQADVITCPFEFPKSIESFGINTTPNIIPYGANLNNFKPREKSPNKFVIVFRANSLMKGAKVALLTLINYGPCIKSILNDRVLELVFIGVLDDSMESELKLICYELNIPLKFGGVPHHEMPNVFSDADLFIMPSLSESMSMMAVEAMAAGVPVILSEECGLGNVLPVNYPYNFKDIDSHKIFMAIKDISQDSKKWYELSSSLVVSAKSLSWEKYEKSIANLTKEILFNEK